MARRQTRGTTPTAPSLIDRMNRGEFDPAPPPPTPSGVSTIGRYKGDLVPSWLTPGLLNFLKRLPFLLILLAIVLFILAVILFFAVGPAAAVIALVIGVVAVGASFAIRCWVQGLEAREVLADVTITGDNYSDRDDTGKFCSIALRSRCQRNGDADGNRGDANCGRCGTSSRRRRTFSTIFPLFRLIHLR